jgi:hypothetical protein
VADIKFLSGIATNISMFSSTSGSSYKGTGSTNTSHTFTFRIDSKPIRFSGVLNLSEGDEVKVAGYDKRGELQATVVKNITTGVSYSDKYRWAAILTITIGILLSVIIITLLFGIPLIVWGIIYNMQVNRNEKLLNSM